MKTTLSAILISVGLLASGASFAADAMPAAGDGATAPAKVVKVKPAKKAKKHKHVKKAAAAQ
jgi:hypothetical protein